MAGVRKRLDRLRFAWVAAAASGLFVLGCAAAYGGLLSHAYPGDGRHYAIYGRALVNDGRIPYGDFYVEYPPGAMPLFAVPALVWDVHYVLLFKLLDDRLRRRHRRLRNVAPTAARARLRPPRADRARGAAARSLSSSTATTHFPPCSVCSR